MLNAPCLQYRNVGKKFAITQHDFEETFQKLNDIDESIEFTMKNISEDNLSFLDCIISFYERRDIITKVYRKPTHTGQYTKFSPNQPLHVKLSTIKTLVRKAKFIFIDKTSLNQEMSYIKRTIQLNEYPLNVNNKTIKNTLQCHNSEHKSEELELLKIFIP